MSMKSFNDFINEAEGTEEGEPQLGSTDGDFKNTNPPGGDDENSGNQEDRPWYDFNLSASWVVGGLAGGYVLKKSAGFVKKISSATNVLEVIHRKYLKNADTVDDALRKAFKNSTVQKAVKDGQLVATELFGSYVKLSNKSAFKNLNKFFKLKYGNYFSKAGIRHISEAVVHFGDDFKGLSKYLVKEAKLMGPDDAKTLIKSLKSEVLDNKVIKDKYKDLLTRGAKGEVLAMGQGGLTKRTMMKVAHKIPGTQLLSRSGGKIASKIGKYALGKGLLKGASFVVKRFVPFIAIADIGYNIASTLIGSKSMYTATEGWSGGKHGTTGKRKESEEVYKLMARGIVKSIGIGKSFAEHLQTSIAPELLIILKRNATIFEKKETSYNTNLDKMMDFLIESKGLVEISKIIKDNKDDLEAAVNIIADMLEDELSGYTIHGEVGVSDVNIINDVAYRDDLDQDDNVYGVEVANKVGGMDVSMGLGLNLDIQLEKAVGLMPELNSLGWAHWFSTSDYLASIDTQGDIDTKSVLGLIYKAHRAIPAKNNHIKLDFEDLSEVVKLLSDGKSFIDPNILQSMDYGIQEDETEFQPLGEGKDLVGILSNYVNNKIEDHIDKEPKIPVTGPLISLAMVFGIRELLNYIVLGGVYYYSTVAKLQAADKQTREMFREYYKDLSLQAEEELVEDTEKEKGAMEKQGLDATSETIADDEPASSQDSQVTASTSSVEDKQDGVEIGLPSISEIPGFDRLIG